MILAEFVATPLHSYLRIQDLYYPPFSVAQKANFLLHVLKSSMAKHLALSVPWMGYHRKFLPSPRSQYSEAHRCFALLSIDNNLPILIATQIYSFCRLIIPLNYA